MNSILKKTYYSAFILSLFIVAIFNGCNKSGVKSDEVLLRQNDSVVEIDNGIVKGIFTLNNPVITQSYYAADGKNWDLLAKSLDRPGITGKNVDPLYASGQNYADDYRLMVQEGLNSISILENRPEKISVQLSGNIGDHIIKQVISLEKDQAFFHFDVTAILPGTTPKIEYLLSSFVFSPGANPILHLRPR